MNAGIAGAELDAAHVSQAVDRQRHHEDARDVGTVGGEHVRGRQCDDEVGSAELPACSPSRHRRTIASPALARALSRPLLEDGYLSSLAVPADDFSSPPLPSRGHHACLSHRSCVACWRAFGTSQSDGADYRGDALSALWKILEHILVKGHLPKQE